jgi:hypothetical protein
MILLNQEVVSPIKIDKDLVMTYKHEGDRYLVAINHNLTKQLVSYLVYYDLQQVNNAFFLILKNLVKGYYETIDDFRADYADFIKKCDLFLKSCDDNIPEGVSGITCKKIDSLKLAVQKLSYIVENICLMEENS